MKSSFLIIIVLALGWGHPAGCEPPGATPGDGLPVSPAVTQPPTSGGKQVTGNNQAAAAETKPPLDGQPEMKPFVESAGQANNLKNQMQSGVQNNTQLAQQYQAATNEAAMWKARLDEKAKSGKYDTKGYEEALAALSIPAQQFNYQPGKESKSDNSQALTPPAPAAQLPETVKTQGIDVTPAPTENLNPIIPTSEIADTRVPVNEAPSRTLASEPEPVAMPQAPLSPPTITTVPGGVVPLNLDGSVGTAAASNQLQTNPSTPEATRNEGNTSRPTSDPTRGIASGADGEPTEEELAALVGQKVLNDHKNKLAAQKGKGAKTDTAKPSLADRLKNSSLNTASAPADAAATATAPSTSSAPTTTDTSLKDELFWFGPQKFGRLLLGATGANKRNSTDTTPREPSSIATATAAEWLQVIVGWMMIAGSMLGAGLLVARRKADKWLDHKPEDDSDRTEPTIKG